MSQNKASYNLDALFCSDGELAGENNDAIARQTRIEIDFLGRPNAANLRKQTANTLSKING